MFSSTSTPFCFSFQKGTTQKATSEITSRWSLFAVGRIYHHAKSSSIKKGAACGHPFRYPCPRKNTNAITGKLNIRPDFAYTRIVRALLSGGHCLQNSITEKNKKLKLRRPWGN